jgi:hypothetical protein
MKKAMPKGYSGKASTRRMAPRGNAVKARTARPRRFGVRERGWGAIRPLPGASSGSNRRCLERQRNEEEGRR